jgi:hypothetical protein
MPCYMYSEQVCEEFFQDVYLSMMFLLLVSKGMDFVNFAKSWKKKGEEVEENSKRQRIIAEFKARALKSLDGVGLSENKPNLKEIGQILNSQL